MTRRTVENAKMQNNNIVSAFSHFSDKKTFHKKTVQNTKTSPNQTQKLPKKFSNHRNLIHHRVIFEIIATMSTFNDRLNTALGGPFEPFMRRSIQTVILFEAHRCLKEKFPSMRPFQKKMAIFDQANYLLNGTALLPHQREEVMWRTGTSKEVLNPDMMWRRTRVVVQDVQKLAKQMEAFAEANPPTPQEGDEPGSKKEHEEVYRAFLQKQYEEMTGKTSETFPPRFEFTHNNCLLVYKMYFNKGTQLDTSFPPPENRELVLPAKKPECAAGPGTPLSCGQRLNKHGVFARSPPGSPMHPGRMQQQKRLEQLREVREYMDLLKQFEGVVDEEALNKRKRELFEALPPAPPACDRNKNQIAKTSHVEGNNTSNDATSGEGSQAQNEFVVL